MATVTQIGPRLGIAPTCAALGLPRATYYRRRRPRHGPPQRWPSPRALTADEQTTVLAQLHEPRFVDLAPAEVYATLLDEGTYLCSERTMYRLLARRAEVRERRDRLRHPAYPAPELLARHPKELWSWDITKLLGPAKWTYFYLYVMLDVFSRYVVGWMVAQRESAALAEPFIHATCTRQGIGRDQLTIHADRGQAMTSKSVAFLLADLGVTKTHSRPHVSNDNPLSEAQFKTLKYRPAFPDRSARSRTLGPTGMSSSRGTTPPITTAASGCSRRTTCTSAWPRSASPRAPPCSPRRIRRILSGSPRAGRRRPRRPPRSGSIPQAPRARGGRAYSLNSIPDCLIPITGPVS